MNQRTLFTPPPRPLDDLCDEHVALRVASKIQQWSRENTGVSGDITDKELNELTEALMGTNSDDWKTVLAWLRKHRPRTEWKAADKVALLEWRLKPQCAAALPADKRRSNK